MKLLLVFQTSNSLSLSLSLCFCVPGEQGRPVYPPAGVEDGGGGVAGLVQLDVELGTGGRGQAQGGEDGRR